MTDPDLMEADCIHGVVWYECDKCPDPMHSEDHYNGDDRIESEDDSF